MSGVLFRWSASTEYRLIKSHKHNIKILKKIQIIHHIHSWITSVYAHNTADSLRLFNLCLSLLLLQVTNPWSFDVPIRFRKHYHFLTRKITVWAGSGNLHSLKLTAKAPENLPSQKEISISTSTIHSQVRKCWFQGGSWLLACCSGAFSNSWKDVASRFSPVCAPLNSGRKEYPVAQVAAPTATTKKMERIPWTWWLEVHGSKSNSYPFGKLTARPWKSPSFLVNTIKMVDFPRLCWFTGGYFKVGPLPVVNGVFHPPFWDRGSYNPQLPISLFGHFKGSRIPHQKLPNSPKGPNSPTNQPPTAGPITKADAITAFWTPRKEARVSGRVSSRLLEGSEQEKINLSHYTDWWVHISWPIISHSLQ